MNLMTLLFGNYKLNTPTSELSNGTIRKIIILSTEWCQENLGFNNDRENVFRLSMLKQVSGPPCYGMFDEQENKIYIFHNNCPNIMLLIQTVLHEYAHYLQPIRGTYNKLMDEYGYDDHPMEIEARDVEGYYLNVWNYIKNKI